MWINFGVCDKYIVSPEIVYENEEKYGSVNDWVQGSQQMLDKIKQSGIKYDDYRLKSFVAKLKQTDGFDHNVVISSSMFTKDINCKLLLDKIHNNKLILNRHNFSLLNSKMTDIYHEMKQNIVKKDEYFGISICTTDGQRCSIGDTDKDINIESISHPILYLMAVNQIGIDKYHENCGTKPCDNLFNHSALINKGNNDNHMIPQNPLINAGSIYSCSILQSTGKTINDYKQIIAKLCGNDDTINENKLHKRDTIIANKNFGLAFTMNENHVFNENINLQEILELYFKTNSIQINSDQICVLLSTLANKGICPLTNDKIFDDNLCQKCLTLISLCSMYKDSPKWHFYTNGLPLIFTRNGIISIIIPNKCNITIYSSSKLNNNGHCIVGIECIKQFVNIINSSNLFKTNLENKTNNNNNNNNNKEWFMGSFQIQDKITQCGLNINDDYRLLPLMQIFDERNAFENNITISSNMFNNINSRTRHKNCDNLLNKIYHNKLIINDFDKIREIIHDLYQEIKEEISIKQQSNKNINYLKELNKIDAELFSISICSVDGQVLYFFIVLYENETPKTKYVCYYNNNML